MSETTPTFTTTAYVASLRSWKTQTGSLHFLSSQGSADEVNPTDELEDGAKVWDGVRVGEKEPLAVGMEVGLKGETSSRTIDLSGRGYVVVAVLRLGNGHVTVACASVDGSSWYAEEVQMASAELAARAGPSTYREFPAEEDWVALRDAVMLKVKENHHDARGPANARMAPNPTFGSNIDTTGTFRADNHDLDQLSRHVGELHELVEQLHNHVENLEGRSSKKGKKRGTAAPDDGAELKGIKTTVQSIAAATKKLASMEKNLVAVTATQTAQAAQLNELQDSVQSIKEMLQQSHGAVGMPAQFVSAATSPVTPSQVFFAAPPAQPPTGGYMMLKPM